DLVDLVDLADGSAYAAPATTTEVTIAARAISRGATSFRATGAAMARDPNTKRRRRASSWHRGAKPAVLRRKGVQKTTGAGVGCAVRDGGSAAPLPSWPYSLLPQHSTAPVSKRTHVELI